MRLATKREGDGRAYSQEDVADAIDVSQAFVSKIERSRTRGRVVPNPETLQRWCDFIGADYELAERLATADEGDEGNHISEHAAGAGRAAREARVRNFGQRLSPELADLPDEFLEEILADLEQRARFLLMEAPQEGNADIAPAHGGDEDTGRGSRRGRRRRAQGSS